MVGVPCNGATKQKKKGESISAKPTKGKQPKQTKPTKVGAVSKCQQKLGTSLDSQSSQQGLSGDAPASKKPKAKYTKKRKVPCDSPPRLPPISPGALSLQAGVKRRRLARQLQEQAAVEAVSESHQKQAQTKRFCAQLDQLAAQAATKASNQADSVGQAIKSGHMTDLPETSAMQVKAHMRHASVEAELGNGEQAPKQGTQQSAEDNSQAQLQGRAQSPASHPASARASGGEEEEENQPLSCPVFGARRVSQGSAAGSQHSAEHQHKADQEQQTLSFDVAAMELFQQQDTCDAFGSFWRRTSGVGMSGAKDSGQHPAAASSPFGGLYSSLHVTVYILCMPSFACISS